MARLVWNEFITYKICMEKKYILLKRLILLEALVKVGYHAIDEKVSRNTGVIAVEPKKDKTFKALERWLRGSVGGAPCQNLPATEHHMAEL